MPTDADDLEAIQVMQRYYRWKRDIIKPHAGHRVLEVGCGTGLLLQQMLPLDLAVGIDSNAECIALAQERLRDAPTVRLSVLDILDESFRDLAGNAFTSVIFSSSIEEIPDDVAALRRTREVLPERGRVIIFAAAMPEITGALDHKFGARRYSKTTMAAAMKDAGFTILSMQYVNLLGALAWWWDSRVMKRREISANTYRVRDLAVPLARFIDRISGPPVGRSILAIGLNP